jgi:hypothetical protein
MKLTFKNYLYEAKYAGWKQPTETDFEEVRMVRGNTLRRGMLVSASYKQFNEGTDYVEILGVTGNDEKYGEGGVKYNSVKECLQANGVRSLKQLEEKDNEGEYGYSHYLVAKDLLAKEDDPEDHKSGAWYYLFEGRWCRGSGAEALSFREIRYVPKQ